MKKLSAIFVLVLFGTMTYAQWTSIAPNYIYNNNPTPARVGVNTAAPMELMHIYTTSAGSSGDARAVFLAESGYAGTATKTLGGFQANAANGDKFLMALRHNAGGYQDLLQSVYNSATSSWSEYMYFRFDNTTWYMRNGVSDARFENTGAVAIGMGTYAIPTGAKLAIGGKVVAKEIEVTLTGMPPDFVFNSDYKLASLYDVENFVNTNKHLPGVPSASEMTTNGVNVGDMNMTLLQKVEELTLYMINLQKENDALKSRVSQLEK